MFTVLLINPYLTTDENNRLFPIEPLGLLYLATYAKRKIGRFNLDIEIGILDAQMEGDKFCIKLDRGYRSGLNDLQLQNKLRQYKPNIIGISNNYTAHTKDILEISKIVKETCQESLLVIGGAHATIAHNDLIKHKEIDIVARGEGETTFWEIIQTTYKKNDYENILGITYKKGNKIKINPDRPIIEDINTLPIPDRSLISYEKYLSHNDYYLTMNKPVGTIFSSRGCPFKCIFCSTQKVWTNKWRGRSPENIINEIEYLKNNYNIKEICFQDDQFMGNNKRVIELCNWIVKKKLKLSFIVPPGISPILINEDVIDAMVKAGFYRICLSIDVGTETAKVFVRKPIKLEKMRNIIKKANSKGLWTYATFVIGFPYQTEEDINKNIEFAYNLHLDFLRFYIAQPHLGSDLYDIYKKRKWLDKEAVEDYHSVFDSLFGTENISAKRLKELRDSAENKYLKFHLRHFFKPLYIIQEFIPKIFSLKRFLYFVRLAYYNLKSP